MPVLGAVCSFLEPFCGHLSRKVDEIFKKGLLIEVSKGLAWSPLPRRLFWRRSAAFFTKEAVLLASLLLTLLKRALEYRGTSPIENRHSLRTAVGAYCRVLERSAFLRARYSCTGWLWPTPKPETPTPIFLPPPPRTGVFFPTSQTRNTENEALNPEPETLQEYLAHQKSRPAEVEGLVTCCRSPPPQAQQAVLMASLLLALGALYRGLSTEDLLDTYPTLNPIPATPLRGGRDLLDLTNLGL